MMVRNKSNFIFKFVAVVAALTLLSHCGKKEDPVETAEKPVIGGSTGSGGMPSDSELADTVAATPEEATSATKTLGGVVGDLALNLSGNSSASLKLLDGDDCDDGFFCIGKAFGTIFDMMAESADCVINRLTKDADGADLEFVEADNIFYIDGFGLIPFGDDGAVNCTAKAKILDWAKANKLIDGEVGTEPGAEEFYPPARFVVRKKADGSFAWKIVFFPTDFISKLVERVPALSGLSDATLDFEVFNGVHTDGAVAETGEGELSVNWNEFRRMVQELDKINGEDTDESMPAGTVAVTYDTVSATNKFTLAFVDGFTFGDDDGEQFFAHDYANTVYRKGDEMHLTFKMGAAFGEPEGDDDEGQPVGFCEYNGDTEMHNYADIAKADYLETPAVSYAQLMWKQPSADEEPTKWVIDLYSVEGGAFIWGDANFSAWSDGSSTGELMAALTGPICPASASTASSWATYVNDNVFNTEVFVVSADNSKATMHIDLNGQGNAALKSKTEAFGSYPSFTSFKIMDNPTAADASPIVE